jgi:hypothetical protein
MNIDAVTPLRLRMVEDMNARKLCAQTQRGHIHSCKRFAEFLKRSPDAATAEDIRRFQLHLSETGMSICNRNRIMTGVKFDAEDSLGVAEVRERHNGIVGKPDKGAVPCEPRTHLALEPFIQHVMQEDV